VRSILSVTLAAAALVAAAAFAEPAAADARTPTLSALSRYTTFKDAVMPSARAAGIPVQTWPFSPNTLTGESVRIHLSQRLYVSSDTTVAQQWADFFDRLVHGPELATLDAYLLSPSEIERVCGPSALACYRPNGNELVAPAQDPQLNLSAESVAAHEYGHHVAAHRLNDPWDAIDTGTKRWASSENVCLKTKKGQYHPGAEDEDHYFTNPGEGFAEAYRVLNERRLALTEAPWEIVTNQFYPDNTALTLLQQDVTSPWTKNTTLARSGSVSKSAPSRAFVVSTPFDGRVAVTLRSSATAKFRLDILSPNSVSIGHASGKNVSARGTVCGERALKVRVKRVSGAGAFRLAISKP
jgi:hypothetical protein